MKQDKEKKIDNMIELYFFDADKSKEEYLEFYKKNCEGRFKTEKRCRYSNLYLLRREIRDNLLIGYKYNPCRKNLSENYFTSIVLLRIAITNLVKMFYGKKRFVEFINKYMGIKSEEYAYILKYLRDGLEHNNYSLFYRVKKDDPTNGKYHVRGEKIYFGLAYIPQRVVLKVRNWKKSYPSSMYLINPRKLYTSFEEGLGKFKGDLINKKNISLRKRFYDKIDRDNWIMM